MVLFLKYRVPTSSSEIKWELFLKLIVFIQENLEMSQVNRHFPSNFQDLLNLNIKFDNNPSQSTAIKTDFDTI